MSNTDLHDVFIEGAYFDDDWLDDPDHYDALTALRTGQTQDTPESCSEYRKLYAIWEWEHGQKDAWACVEHKVRCGRCRDGIADS